MWWNRTEKKGHNNHSVKNIVKPKEKKKKKEKDKLGK